MGVSATLEAAVGKADQYRLTLLLCRILERRHTEEMGGGLFGVVTYNTDVS